MVAELDVETLIATVIVSGVVSFAVSGLLKQLASFVSRHWRRAMERRRLRLDGDHLVIETASPLGVGPGKASSRVRVRVAPSRQLASGHLDPETIEVWLTDGVFEPLHMSRQYCDPDQLVRYEQGDFVAEVGVNGLVDVIAPVSDRVYDNCSLNHELDLGSVIDVAVVIVASLLDGAFVAMFPDRLRSFRLDWYFDVSREPFGVRDVFGPTPSRVGLAFPGREPESSTPGQPTPVAGHFGFASPQLRSVPIQTGPVEVVERFLRGLVERSGYTGNERALHDIRLRAEASLRRYRTDREVHQSV